MFRALVIAGGAVETREFCVNSVVHGLFDARQPQLSFAAVRFANHHAISSRVPKR